MIYCQLAPRFTLDIGVPLRLKDIARVIGPVGLEELMLPCPDEPGTWQLDALQVAGALQRACPGDTVTMLGPDSCFIHRVKPARRGPTRLLRTICALLILVAGSALGLAWFHSDVDMPRAMQDVYMLITGQDVSDVRLITIPYIIGVALGAGVFYALFDRRAVTPMDVKLSDYRQDMERAEAKHVQ